MVIPLTDHLGSTSITLNATGQFVAELRYKAFGETRYAKNNTPTDYRYTGQLQQAEIGLYYYGARWYDPMLGRFAQADTIVPEAGNPQAFDRYAYVNNSPLNHTDSTGHYSDCSQVPQQARSSCESGNQQEAYGAVLGKLGGKHDDLKSWSTSNLLRLLGWLNRGIVFEGSHDPHNAWTAGNYSDAIDALDRVESFLGAETNKALGLSNGGILVFTKLAGTNPGGHVSFQNQIRMFLPGSSSESNIETFIHEIGHIVAINYGVVGFKNGYASFTAKYSNQWLQASGWSLDANNQWISLGNGVSDYANQSNPSEDFAESFTFLVEGGNYSRRHNPSFLSGPRKAFITNLIFGTP